MSPTTCRRAVHKSNPHLVPSLTCNLRAPHDLCGKFEQSSYHCSSAQDDKFEKKTRNSFHRLHYKLINTFMNNSLAISLFIFMWHHRYTSKRIGECDIRDVATARTALSDIHFTAYHSVSLYKAIELSGMYSALKFQIPQAVVAFSELTLGSLVNIIGIIDILLCLAISHWYLWGYRDSTTLFTAI